MRRVTGRITLTTTISEAPCSKTPDSDRLPVDAALSVHFYVSDAFLIGAHKGQLSLKTHKKLLLLLRTKQTPAYPVTDAAIARVGVVV
jgi:hypothetical protein